MSNKRTTGRAIGPSDPSKDLSGASLQDSISTVIDYLFYSCMGGELDPNSPWCTIHNSLSDLLRQIVVKEASPHVSTHSPVIWRSIGLGDFDPEAEENVRGEEGFKVLPGDKMIGQPRNIRYYLPHKRLLVLGPSGTLGKYDKKYLQRKRDDGFQILAFSSSPFWYLYDMGFKPDFFNFYDPSALCQALLESATGIPTSLSERDAKLAWCNEISFLGYNVLTFGDLLRTNESLHGSARHGNSHFLSRSDFVEFYANHNLFDIFGYCICRNPSVVTHDILGENLDPLSKVPVRADFADNLLYVTRHGREIDKFTHVLLPLIFYWFRDLEEMTCLGFGTFEAARYKGSSGSYDRYKEAFDKICPKMKEFLNAKNYKLTFEESSYFNKLLEPIDE